MHLLVGDPRGIWLLLAAMVFLLVFARRRRANVVLLTTFFLLQRLYERLPVLSRRVRLLRRLSQALFAAAALAAAGAGLRPTLASDAPPLRELFVLDLSPSLGISEADGSTRLAGLKRAAGAYLDQVRPEDTLVLLEAGPHAVVANPGDLDALRRRLDGLDYQDAAVDTARAAQLAAALNRQQSFDRVLVFSDRPARWTGAVAAAAGFSPHFVSFGGMVANVGIDRFDVQPDLAQPSAWRLFARASCPGASSGGAPARLRLEVSNNQTPVATIDRDCTATTPVVLELQRLELAPGTIEVRLLPGDAYPGDDRVEAGIAPPALAPIYLVSAGNPYLEAAFGADPALRFERLAPGQPLPKAPQAVFVFDGAASPDPLPERALFIRPDRALAALTPRSIGSYPDRITWESGDPLLRAVNLDGLAVRDYVEFFPNTVFHEAAAADGRPLVLSYADEGRRWVVLGFDPSETNLVYSAAYPLLVANALRWLSLFTPAERPFLRLGERVELPVEACGGRVVLPGGASAALATECGAGLSFDAVRHPGAYRVEARSGETLGVFHVNVLDPAVTAEIAGPGFGAGGTPRPPELARGRRRIELTPWLALAALFCLASARLIAPPGASARL
jgi:hypothetical protein